MGFSVLVRVQGPQKSAQPERKLKPFLLCTSSGSFSKLGSLFGCRVLGLRDLSGSFSHLGSRFGVPNIAQHPYKKDLKKATPI